MKKGLWPVIVFVFLFIVQGVFAQDYKATAEVLELQLQILEMQSTIDALSAGGNSGFSPTPTPRPVDNSNIYSNTTVTSRNFPSYARPVSPTGSIPTWTKPYSRYLTEITVGSNGKYRTIAEALKNIPSKAGEVILYLVSDTEEPSDGIGIPIDKGITSLRIASNNKNHRTIWPSGRSIWFFCNGIPLEVDDTITFAEKSMIMGGLLTYSNHNVTASKSAILMNGNAHWIYAGGQSDRTGHTSTVDEALVIINGKVDRVYAGGRSILGETFVNNSTIVVKGTANEVYCAGYTENGSARATVGQANIKIYGRYNKFGLGLGAGESVLLTPVGCYQ